MVVLESGGDIDAVDHLLDDLLVNRLLALNLILALPRCLVFIDLHAIREQAPLVLRAVSLE